MKRSRLLYQYLVKIFHLGDAKALILQSFNRGNFRTSSNGKFWLDAGIKIGLGFTLLLVPVNAQQDATETEEPSEEVKDPAIRQRLIEENARALTLGNNIFAVTLYSRLKTQSGNLFFSPYAISAAMAMPYAGAAVATKEQIHSVMHYLQKDINVFEAFSWMNRFFTRSHFEGPNETRLFIGNSVWFQRDVKILPGFANTMATYFSAALRPADFMRNPESARLNINDWVRERTQGRITNLVGPQDVDKNTRLAVISAIFMKAVWAQAFDPSLTYQGSFFVSSKETASAQMMTTSGQFPLYQAPTFTLLEMPYRATQMGEPHFSLLIFLPTDNFGLAGVESAVVAETLETWLRAVQRRSVIVQVPKFKLTSEFRLRETLQNMGLGIPFSEYADFSGISDTVDMSLNDVIHKAYLQLDEKGTEAIAATAITINKKSAMEPESAVVFRADHPFLFMIVDRVTNSILFMGRLVSL